MIMDRVWHDDVFRAEIRWQDPIYYDEVYLLNPELQENVFFYKILGTHGGRYSLFYIGKVFGQYVSVRLKNADHLEKRMIWQSENKRTKLMVSIGELHSQHYNEIRLKKNKAKMIDDLESLLIYSHSDHLKFKNKQSIGSHRIMYEYHLRNSGFLDEGMLSEIAYGMFYRE